jgi:hypothetical protein
VKLLSWGRIQEHVSLAFISHVAPKDSATNLEDEIGIEPTYDRICSPTPYRLGYSSTWCERWDSSPQNRVFKTQMSPCCITLAKLIGENKRPEHFFIFSEVTLAYTTPKYSQKEHATTGMAFAVSV